MKEGLNNLWNRIQDGDEKAFDSLFRELYPLLLSFAFRILRKKPDAEEITQDAFINLWKQRDTIEIKGSLKSYLYQAVHNLSLNRLEHFKTKKFLPNNNTLDRGQWDLIRDTYVVNDDLIEMIESKDTESIILKAIEELPQRCREIFILSRFDNLGYDEISKKLNISENTIRVQIFRALKAISETIRKIN
jgi:RNA polymerase sigma-70 factor, ECF subfamily